MHQMGEIKVSLPPSFPPFLPPSLALPPSVSLFLARARARSLSLSLARAVSLNPKLSTLNLLQAEFVFAV